MQQHRMYDSRVIENRGGAVDYYLENKTIIIVDAVNSWNSFFIDDGFSTFEDLLDQIYENLVTKLKFVPDYSCPWNNMLQICFFLHEVYKNIDSATKI